MHARPKRVTSLVRYFPLVDGIKITFRFHFDDNYFIFTKTSQLLWPVPSKYVLLKSCPSLPATSRLFRTPYQSSIDENVCWLLNLNDHRVWYVQYQIDQINAKVLRIISEKARSLICQKLKTIFTWKLYEFHNQFEYFKLYPYVVDAARNFNRTGWIGSRYSSPLHNGTSIEIDQGRLIIRWRGK